MEKILECIPNFSEGQRPEVIEAIASEISAVPGCYLLHVDPGYSAHRTVMTMAGEPEAVIEAAFRAIQKASLLIDMRQHKGVHPRMGATDVCPLVPVSGLNLKEADQYAQTLASRVGEELNIPVYLYESSAQRPERENLAIIRKGEYEGFREKILQPDWQPDFGPATFHEKAGQTVIGARPFLAAYNFNLNTRSVHLASRIARKVRESGYLQDQGGQKVRKKGRCPGMKAIGWYVEEYGIAQVSSNLTRLDQTPVHVAFEAVREEALKLGLRLTGSELIGLLPKSVLLEAGSFYLKRQGQPETQEEGELMHVAVTSLGLNDLAPFDLRERIIEYRLEDLATP
ncbi:MAG: glutamate formimidoyltransferase [Bacteroidota bacterium]